MDSETGKLRYLSGREQKQMEAIHPGRWREVPEGCVPLLQAMTRRARREWLRRFTKAKDKGMDETQAAELAFKAVAR